VRHRPIPEIDAAIDAYLQAERDALDIPSLPAFGAAEALSREAWRRAERRLAAALRGRDEAYFRAGFRWCLDSCGDLVRVPDVSGYKHVTHDANFNRRLRARSKT
jgi:hypothetical protein